MTHNCLKDFIAIQGIQIGMSVWYVHAFINGDNTDAISTQYKITSVPYISDVTGTYFVDAIYADCGFKTQFSLNDVGFPSGNNYNDHKLCFSKFEADLYCFDVKLKLITSRVTSNLLFD